MFEVCGQHGTEALRWPSQRATKCAVPGRIPSQVLLPGLVLLNTSFSKSCLWRSQRGRWEAEWWSGSGAERRRSGSECSWPGKVLAVNVLKDRGWQHITRHFGNVAGAEPKCALPGTATDWQEDGPTNLMNHLSPPQYCSVFILHSDTTSEFSICQITGLSWICAGAVPQGSSVVQLSPP